jgi:hypothetical protein
LNRHGWIDHRRPELSRDERQFRRDFGGRHAEILLEDVRQSDSKTIEDATDRFGLAGPRHPPSHAAAVELGAGRPRSREVYVVFLGVISPSRVSDYEESELAKRRAGREGRLRRSVLLVVHELLSALSNFADRICLLVQMPIRVGWIET